MSVVGLAALALAVVAAVGVWRFTSINQAFKATSTLRSVKIIT